MTGPLLLDEIVARGPARRGGRVPPGIWTQITNARINAHRFLFDERASEIAGQFAIRCPDLVLNNRQFAIPPYHAVYVEVDSKAFFSCANNTPDDLGERDDRVGYLVLGSYVYTLFARDDAGAPALSFWRYQVVPPGQVAQQDTVTIKGKLMDTKLREDVDPVEFEKFREVSGKLAILCGGALNVEGDESLDDGVKIYDGNFNVWLDIASECSIQWLAPHSEYAQHPLPLKTARGFFGDVRNFWALMLWLNQPSRTTFITVPGGRKIVRGKPTPYLAHNVVTINLGRARTVRRAYELAVERRAPKAHDVRGHFRHLGGYRHCHGGAPHAWPLEPDERGHWTCPRCHKERWHVAPHRRGDASKGVVLKHYEVKGEEADQRRE